MAPQLGWRSTHSPQSEAVMVEFIGTSQSAQHLSDREGEAEKAGRVVQDILEARSPRLPDIPKRMPGQPAASYKTVHGRVLRSCNDDEALLKAYPGLEKEATGIEGGASNPALGLNRGSPVSIVPQSVVRLEGDEYLPDQFGCRAGRLDGEIEPDHGLGRTGFVSDAGQVQLAPHHDDTAA